MIDTTIIHTHRVIDRNNETFIMAKKTWKAINEGYQSGIQKMFDECLASIENSDDPNIINSKAALIEMLEKQRDRCQTTKASYDILEIVY